MKSKSKPVVQPRVRKPIIIIVPPPTLRNPFASLANARRIDKFKDKRQPRGGARNKQRDYHEED